MLGTLGATLRLIGVHSARLQSEDIGSNLGVSSGYTLNGFRYEAIQSNDVCLI